MGNSMTKSEDGVSEKAKGPVPSSLLLEPHPLLLEPHPLPLEPHPLAPQPSAPPQYSEVPHIPQQFPFKPGDPAQYPQSPPQYSEFPPQQPPKTAPCVQGGELKSVECEVCQHQIQYYINPGETVSTVKCTHCNEVTPIAPAPEGKVYGRCPFCHCCLLGGVGAKNQICPRGTCQKILRALLKDGRTVCRLPCEVCQKEMQYFEDSSSDVCTVTCSQCGESTAIKPPPAGKIRSRCPYCHCSFLHKESVEIIRCPRETCGRAMSVGRGPKLSVLCDVCHQSIVYRGAQRWKVMCGLCNQSTVVGQPPPGQACQRCLCGALLTHRSEVLMVKCPIAGCGRIVQAASTCTEVTADK